MIPVLSILDTSIILLVLQLTELIHDDGSSTENTFEALPTEIGAEEVGRGCDMISWSPGTS